MCITCQFSTGFPRFCFQNEVTINFMLPVSENKKTSVLFRPCYTLKLRRMKWETITSAIGHKAFALWKNGRKLITLVFNPASNAARVEYEDEKRVFLVRNEGFLKNRTVLRNEYGVQVAQAGFERDEAFIEVNKERYFYSVDQTEHPAVTFYKESKENPLAVCALDATDFPKTNKRFLSQAQYSLLMALCLYVFQPAASVPEVAAG